MVAVVVRVVVDPGFSEFVTDGLGLMSMASMVSKKARLSLASTVTACTQSQEKKKTTLVI